MKPARRTPQERDLIAAASIHTAANRFWAKVEKTDSCWVWHGSINAYGYGSFSLGREMYLAHRLAWILTRGPSINQPMLDHTCHNRRCVNPNHLRPCTSKLNAENRAGTQKNKRTETPLGVTWDRDRRKWFACIGHNGKTIPLGRYESVEEAAEVVRSARIRNHKFYQST